ncbi:sulfotransferase [Stutzerimonas stutzeri]|uniref:sulfotransferase n=1 Tax=Stutzerimonas stutzeri TaxID=316 RepID=UPI00210D6872|nr:sulfotransferase [Stutzerimonas stutzeri]MCQ4321759.1 sulfotransferase [Stutzerimonas stutzeri]
MPQKISTNLRAMQQELRSALDLIKQNQLDSDREIVEVADSLSNNQSLLERCNAVTADIESQKKPTLRIIHHLACSGGTLISKCLAVQPNVFLLSEIHPTTRLGMNIDEAAYTPRDITTQAIYGRIPNVDTLAEKLFLYGIIETEKYIRKQGGYLVIRAHTHADYCTDKPAPEVDTLKRLLEPHFDIKHLVTVRNPIDPYLSLLNNGWTHFTPCNLDEYAVRYLAFLNQHADCRIYKYEDFVISPNETMFDLCVALEIPYNANYRDSFSAYQLSGDSGRSGAIIAERERRPVSDQIRCEADNSENWNKLCLRLDYPSTF